jgi:hypothetical protein
MSELVAQPLPTIKDVVLKVSASFAGAKPAKQLGKSTAKVFVAFDASDSTGTRFESQTVRQVQWTSIVRYISEEYPGIEEITVRFFGRNRSQDLKIPVRWPLGGSAQILYPQQLAENGFSGAGTNTALGLEGAEKYDAAVCGTDGQTDASPDVLARISKAMKDAGTSLTVIVVTAQNLDLPNLSEGQIQRLPGLELLSRMEISNTIITCLNYKHVVAQQTVAGSVSRHLLMDVPFPKQIPFGILFEMIISNLESAPFSKSDTFEFLTGLFSIMAPFDSSALATPSESTKFLLSRLQKLFPEQPDGEILDLAKFSIRSRLGVGLVAGAARAYEERKKEDQKLIYARISQTHTKNGLVGNQPTAVVLPIRGLMLVGNRERFDESCDKYQRSADKLGNIGLALVEPHHLADFERSQEFRQGTRIVIKLGAEFPAAESSTEAIMAIPLMMLMMRLTGADDTSMGMLRTGAIAQWNMTISSLTDKGLSNIIWNILVAGDMPSLKIGANTITLMDYLAQKVKFIPLHNPVNWAVVMACLGDEAYEAQKRHFAPALSELNIKADNASACLAWFAETFGPYVEGKIPFVDARVPQCAISGDFLIGTVKQALPHGECTSKECITLQAHQSLADFPDLGPNFCPFCRGRNAVWKDVQLLDPEVAVSKAMYEKRPFSIKGLEGITLPCMSAPGKDGPWNWKALCIGTPSPVVVHAAHAGGGGAAHAGGGGAAHAGGGGAAAPVAVPIPMASSSGPNLKKVISLNGPSSSDKTKARELLVRLLEMNCIVVILCLREKLAEGISKKAFNGYAQQTVGSTKKTAEYRGKKFVVILDLDDDSPISDQYGIRWSDYTKSIFAPNFWIDEASVSAFIKANDMA